MPNPTPNKKPKPKRAPRLGEGRPSKLPDPWLTLAAHCGGVGKLAAKLGTTYSTLWRWASGETKPMPVFQVKIDALQKKVDRQRQTAQTA